MKAVYITLSGKLGWLPLSAIKFLGDDRVLWLVDGSNYQLDYSDSDTVKRALQS